MRVLLAVLLASACAAPVQSSPADDPTRSPVPPSVVSPTPHTAVSARLAVPALAEGDRYAAAVDSAARHGLRVWVEADLLKHWLEGPTAFRVAVDRVAALAQRPGVVGIKVADELGYRDGVAGQPERARQFVSASRDALRARVPAARLLVDLIVPELGCGTDTACVRRSRQRDPGLSLAEVDRLLAIGGLDAVNLSTGLLAAKTYTQRGTTRDAVQAAAWQQVVRRGWPGVVELRARKALAHPGRYTGQAEADLRTWVDVPHQQGAAAVDIWTWRQTYKDEVVRLMDPGLVPNALYGGLVRRRAAGVPLMTHLTPSSLEVGLEVDMTALARAFSEVLIAAGTG